MSRAAPSTLLSKQAAGRDVAPTSGSSMPAWVAEAEAAIANTAAWQVSVASRARLRQLEHS